MDAAPPARLPLAVALPAGGELRVREMTPGDTDGIVELYAGLGSRDRHRRFFSQFPARREWVETWTQRCLDDGAAIVAVAPDGRIVGEAAYVVQPNGDGEFSLTVDSSWRGWLGPFLLDVLVGVAAANGVPNLEADILTENTPMRGIVRRRDAVLTGESDASVQHVVLGTRGRQAVWPPVPSPEERGRVLVEAPGGRWAPAQAATRAGYAVLGCAGPDRRAGAPCPMRDGRPCPLAAGADAIVVAFPGDSDAGAWLVEQHARLHPGVPVLVVDASGGSRGAGPEAATVGGASEGRGCRLAAGTPSAVLLDELGRLVRRRDLRPSRGTEAADTLDERPPSSDR